jgi:hypothetical protein
VLHSSYGVAAVYGPYWCQACFGVFARSSLFLSISDDDRNVVGTLMVTSFYLPLDGTNMY